MMFKFGNKSASRTCARIPLNARNLQFTPVAGTKRQSSATQQRGAKSGRPRREACIAHALMPFIAKVIPFSPIINFRHSWHKTNTYGINMAAISYICHLASVCTLLNEDITRRVEPIVSLPASLRVPICAGYSLRTYYFPLPPLWLIYEASRFDSQS